MYGSSRTRCSLSRVHDASCHPFLYLAPWRYHMPDPRSRSQLFLPLWLFIGIGFLLMLSSLWSVPAREQLSYSDFKTMLRQGRIAQVQIGTHTLQGTVQPPAENKNAPPQSFVTVRVEDPDLLHALEAQGVQYRGQYDNPWLKTLLAWLIPLSVGLIIWTFVIRRMGLGQGVMQFGKSR